MPVILTPEAAATVYAIAGASWAWLEKVLHTSTVGQASNDVSSKKVRVPSRKASRPKVKMHR